MRSLIFLAIVITLANASYLDRLRFRRLINRYQNGFDQYDQDLLGNRYGNSLDINDEYTNDYDDDEYTRERLYGREQGRCVGMQCMLDLRGDDIEDRYRRDRDDDSDDESIVGDYSREYEDDEEQGLGVGSESIKEIELANAKLATGLYKQCKNEKDDKNTVVSPLSVQLALAALNQGARRNTKREIGRVIGGRLQTKEHRRIFKKLVRKLKRCGLTDEYSSGSRSTVVKPVTGIFLTTTTRAQQNFVQLVRSCATTVQHCNFHSQPQQCRRMINNWLSTKTQHKINKIVPQDAITDNTKMIVVNSLQLKAKWGEQMRRHVTKEAKFYPLETKKVKIVQVLETQGRFKYYEDELVKVVGIPTENHQLTLYTIVPKDKDGLTDIEKVHLQNEIQLKKILKKADRQLRHVGIQLPKFEIKHKINVRPTLRKQGVEDAFDSKRADFTGICSGGEYLDETDEYENEYQTSFYRNPFIMNEINDKKCKLHLNKLIHQTTIKITEKGITTTTTGRQNEIDDQYDHIRNLEEFDTFDEIVGLDRRDLTGGENVVKANRAFAFVVKHNPTNQLILIGRVIDAAQKKINYVQQTIDNVDQL